MEKRTAANKKKHHGLTLHTRLKAGCRVWIYPDAENDYSKCREACVEDNWCRIFNTVKDGQKLNSTQQKNLDSRVSECQKYWCDHLSPY